MNTKVNYYTKRIMFYVLFLTGVCMVLAGTLMPFFQFDPCWLRVVLMLGSWGIGISMVVAVLEFEDIFQPAWIVAHDKMGIAEHKARQKAYKAGHDTIFQLWNEDKDWDVSNGPVGNEEEY